MNELEKYIEELKEADVKSKYEISVLQATCERIRSITENLIEINDDMKVPDNTISKLKEENEKLVDLLHGKAEIKEVTKCEHEWLLPIDPTEFTICARCRATTSCEHEWEFTNTAYKCTKCGISVPKLKPSQMTSKMFEEPGKPEECKHEWNLSGQRCVKCGILRSRQSIED